MICRHRHKISLMLSVSTTFFSICSNIQYVRTPPSQSRAKWFFHGCLSKTRARKTTMDLNPVRIWYFPLYYHDSHTRLIVNALETFPFVIVVRIRGSSSIFDFNLLIFSIHNRFSFSYWTACTLLLLKKHLDPQYFHFCDLMSHRSVPDLFFSQLYHSICLLDSC